MRSLLGWSWVILIAACKDAGPAGPAPLRDQIVFVADRDGGNDLYVMPRTGGTPTRLTSIGTAGSPHVSRDGRTILFGCGSDICRVNADGTELTHLTVSGQEGYAVWSRDETQIAFSSSRDGNTEIYRMAADGSGQTRLTNNSAQDVGPSWSSDGTLLLFETDRAAPSPGASSEIYVMGADGSNQHALATTSSSDYQPVWSHDGRSIAFGSARNRVNQVFIMQADGTQQRLLTGVPAGDPAWSFDDEFIALTELSGQVSTISIIRADGTGLTPLTGTEFQSSHPSFSP